MSASIVVSNNFSRIKAVNKSRVYFTVNKKQVENVITVFAFFLALLICNDAIAFTTPAAGSFGYNIYDIAVNKVAKGPIGFVGGGWLIAMAATRMGEGWVRALPFAIAGSCLIKLDELTQSLGAQIW